MIVTFNIVDSSGNNIKGLTFTPGDGIAASTKNSPFQYDYGVLTVPVIALFDRIGYSPASQNVEIDATSYTITLRSVTYCSITDIRNMLNPMTKGMGPDVLSDDLVENNIKKAEGLINSYIGSIYTLPFTTGNVPSIIKTICADLACYYCLLILFSRDSQNENEWIETFYTKHIDIINKNGTLDKIKDGCLTIIGEDGTEAPKPRESIKSDTEDYHPTFDVDNPLNWNQDKDRLDDISNRRSS
jgi:phage gp36-like protein